MYHICDVACCVLIMWLVCCRVGLGEEEVESWILIGEPSRKHPGIHCKKSVLLPSNNSTGNIIAVV